MAGLLLKDLYTLRQYGKSMLFMLVFFSLLSLGMDNPATFSEGFFLLMSSMMIIYSFSYDTLAKWDRYALALPVTRRDIVMSKYLLAVLLIAGGTIVSFCLSYVILQFKPVEGFGLEEHLIATIGILSVAILFVSLLLPLVFKFGVEKSRLFLIAIFAAPTAAILVMKQLGLPTPSESDLTAILKLAPLICLALFVLSYFISLKIYSKKEF